jgi:H/ACA ribonucleoprotein complex subunit 3
LVWQLRRCVNCSRYTLKKDTCPYCGGPVRIPHPAKFSPDDKYLKYRMAMKRSSSE